MNTSAGDTEKGAEGFSVRAKIFHVDVFVIQGREPVGAARIARELDAVGLAHVIDLDPVEVAPERRIRLQDADAGIRIGLKEAAVPEKLAHRDPHRRHFAELFEFHKVVRMHGLLVSVEKL